MYADGRQEGLEQFSAGEGLLLRLFGMLCYDFA